MNNLNFTAFDFETAIGKSPCQIGVAIVRDGVIIHSESHLIKPPRNIYSADTIMVHGIYPKETENAPEFPEIWDKIKRHFSSTDIVAHNINFDYSVLENVSERYNIDLGIITGDLICTCDLNNRASLKDCCRDYDIKLTNHHDGEADALACAELYIKMCTQGVLQVRKTAKTPRDNAYYRERSRVEKLLQSTNIGLFDNQTAYDNTHILYNKRVCFLGTFKDKARKSKIIEMLNIQDGNSPSKNVCLIVTGSGVKEDHIKKINELKHDGYNLKVVNEVEFFGIVDRQACDFNIAPPVKKVDITYDFILHSNIIPKVTHMPLDIGRHKLGSKDIYIKSSIGDIDAIAQCLGNLGAMTSYNISDSIDYIWLTDSCVDNLKAGIKDDLIVEIESFYNSSKSTKFNYKFILESEVIDYIERRANELNDDFSLSLIEQFKEKAYCNISKIKNQISDSCIKIPEDKHYSKIKGKYVFRLSDGRVWVPSRQIDD